MDISIHPNYVCDANDYRYDGCVLTLAESVYEMPGYIEDGKLPSADDCAYKPVPETNCQVFGYGVTDTTTGDTSQVLQGVDIPICDDRTA